MQACQTGDPDSPFLFGKLVSARQCPSCGSLATVSEDDLRQHDLIERSIEAAGSGNKVLRAWTLDLFIALLINMAWMIGLYVVLTLRGFRTVPPILPLQVLYLGAMFLPLIIAVWRAVRITQWRSAARNPDRTPIEELTHRRTCSVCSFRWDDRNYKVFDVNEIVQP